MQLVPKALKVLVLAAGALAIACCYTYSAARSGVSYESRLVRLSLTDSGSVMLGSQIGQSVTAIEGRLVVDSAATYVVSVQSTQRQDGAIVAWQGQPVAGPQVP